MRRGSCRLFCGLWVFSRDARKICVVAADAVANALGQSTNVVGPCAYPYRFFESSGEGSVLEGNAGLFIDDGIRVSFGVGDMGGGGNVLILPWCYVIGQAVSVKYVCLVKYRVIMVGSNQVGYVRVDRGRGRYLHPWGWGCHPWRRCIHPRR